MPPAPPTLSAGPDGQAASLTWTAGADPVSLYRIYRGTVMGGAKTALAIGLGSARSYRDNHTAPFTTYYYEVSGVSEDGVEGSRSNEVSVATGDTAPAPPTAPRR